LIRLVVALVIGCGTLWLGFFVLRAFARPVPEPPPPGQLRRVDLRYRCRVCGAEMRMTSAPEELPEPPRHCLDEMDLVAPPFE
jgi:hypothetical protein